MAIAIKPGTLAWSALSSIVQEPGEHTCSQLALDLCPVLAPSPFNRPTDEPLSACRPIFRSFADLLDRRRRLEEHALVVAEKRRVAQARMALTLGRLQEAGLIERRRRRIAVLPSFATRAAGRGIETALAWARCAAPCFEERRVPAGAWEGGTITAEGGLIEEDDALDEEDEDALDDEEEGDESPEENDEAPVCSAPGGMAPAGEGLLLQLLDALLLRGSRSCSARSLPVPASGPTPGWAQRVWSTCRLTGGRPRPGGR